MHYSQVKRNLQAINLNLYIYIVLYYSQEIICQFVESKTTVYCQ